MVLMQNFVHQCFRAWIITGQKATVLASVTNAAKPSRVTTASQDYDVRGVKLQ